VPCLFLPLLLQAARPASLLLLLLLVLLVVVGFISLCFFAGASFRCFLFRWLASFRCFFFRGSLVSYIFRTNSPLQPQSCSPSL
jgi:hypothetical protein